MEKILFLETCKWEDEHWWFIARRNIFKKILDKYIGNFPKDLNEIDILEIGCGTGGNLPLLSSYGRLNAIEVDATARQLAQKRAICPVDYGRLPDDISLDKKFNLICLLDVLEHLADDTEALLSIKGYLKSNGYILLTVPAYKFLWTNHDVLNHHKRRYTKKTLQTVIQKAGFSICYLTYFNTLLFPFIVFKRFLNKILFNKMESDVDMPNKFLNRTLLSIFSLEAIFIPRISFPFGVSLLAVLKRRD